MLGGELKCILTMHTPQEYMSMYIYNISCALGNNVFLCQIPVRKDQRCKNIGIRLRWHVQQYFILDLLWWAPRETRSFWRCIFQFQQKQHLMLDVFNCPIMDPQRQALGSPCAPFSGNDITTTNKTFDSRCVQLANNGRAARFMLSLYVFNFPSMVLQQKHI